MSYELQVSSQFSAAHALRHYQGKCERLHGHNFAITLAIRGTSPEPETGMLLDFAIMKKALATVLETMDHAVLNELPAFASISPSSENLAAHIGAAIQLLLADSLCKAGAWVHSVSVSEKPGQTAIWFA